MPETTLKREVLTKYACNEIFIETGTASGEGVAVALDVGFKQIVSIEANVQAYEKACLRFYKILPPIDSIVKLVLGDSGRVLDGVLDEIGDKPVTFWIDAHCSTGEPNLGDEISRCPVLGDLDAIMRHKNDKHVILIDDMRFFRAGIPLWHDITIGDIIDRVMAIDENFKIGFEDGFCKNDILVARKEEQQNFDPIVSIVQKDLIQNKPPSGVGRHKT